MSEAPETIGIEQGGRDFQPSATGPVIRWLLAVLICLALGYTWTSNTVWVNGVALGTLLSLGAAVRLIDRSRRRLLDQLERKAFLDPLTGLSNRARFVDRLQHAVKYGCTVAPSRATDRLVATGRVATLHDDFAVLFIDLDRFKVVNDSLGHLAGDRLLAGVAERLAGCLRSDEQPARIGGDEFAVLAKKCDEAGAIAVALRIRAALIEPFMVQGQEIFIDSSIGIVVPGEGHGDAESLLRDADVAMYQAKAQGSGNYAVFDASMRDAARRMLELDSSLRRALEREELLVRYQPIIELGTRRLEGFEALVRWQKPGEGLVSPAEFLPRAEETGQIIEIDRWVLDEACSQLAAWDEAHPGARHLKMSVNLSARQFKTGDLVDVVAGALRRAGFAPERLQLEIAETALMEHCDDTRDALVGLKELGVTLMIDDFGTGWSALGYLQRYPLDVLKIDRTFVSSMSLTSQGDLAGSIVAIAESLGLKVVAEGIETEFQFERLKSLACGFGQGFLFSKPIPAGQAEVLVAEEGAMPRAQQEADGAGASGAWTALTKGFNALITGAFSVVDSDVRGLDDDGDYDQDDPAVALISGTFARGSTQAPVTLNSGTFMWGEDGSSLTLGG